MLATRVKTGNTKSGFEYNRQEDNYFQGDEQSFFYGQLADELGFGHKAKISDESLLNALEGRDANGNQLVKAKYDEHGYRDGAYSEFDVAADKSASLAYEMALQQGNKELADKISQAWQHATEKALDLVEHEYMYCRSDEVAQSKMLAAVYNHYECRKDTKGNINPHLHSHILIMSHTKDMDGKSRKFDNRKLTLDHRYIGLVARAEFAKKLQELGIKIDVYDAKNAFFSIGERDTEILKEFSGRREMMLEKMAELKADPAFMAKYPNIADDTLLEMIKKETRNWKDKSIDKKGVMAENARRAESLSYELPKIEAQSVIKQTLTPNQVLSQAIEDLIEHQSVFTDKELKSQALKIGLDQGIVLQDVKEAITNNIDLVKTRKGWTTREMIALEAKILAQKDNKSTNFIISNTQETNTAIAEYQKRKGFELKRGQNDLVHAALNSDSQFIVAQGVAGAGKTTSLEVVKAICDTHGHNIIGLAPQAAQAQNLEKESGIKSNTVASFLLNEELQASAKNSIIILDEAGMLGTRFMAKLFTIAQAQNAKLILSGDINQKKSISQGDAFKFLQENGFTTVSLDEGNRQKTNDLKIAVKHILNHDIASAIKTLQASKNDEVVELTDRDARLLKAKDEYLKDPENSLLMARTNVDRRELNAMIRQELVAGGKITNSSTFSTREIPAMDNLEKRQSRYYQEGQTLYLSANVGKISAGREAKIISIDKENNTLIIEHEAQAKGKKTLIKETVNLSTQGQNLNIYAETKTDFGVNDTIIFKKKDKSLGLLNGHMGKITNIQGDKITALVNDKEVIFTTKQYPYIQHGYCVTDFAAQGKSIDHAIMLSDQVNFNDWYTQITRAKHKVTVITSSIDNLIKSAARESVKLNALSEANISTVKKLKQIIKGYENGRIHRAITESKDTARDYHRSARVTLEDLTRTLKRFAKSSAEQWRKSALYRAFTSDKGVKYELKELQKGINEVQNELQNKNLTLHQGVEQQMTIKPSKEPVVHQAVQEDTQYEEEGQSR